MIIANAIFYNGQSADKVYIGENLVREKQTTPPTPTYGSKTFAGKFTDSSTSDNWLWWVNGASGTNNATNIADKVDPTTKEFNFDYNGTLTSCKYMFGGNSSYNRYERIDHIPDTSQVTDMSWMFANCNDLKSVNLADLDTSQVTNMRNMFSSCKALTSLDLSNLDTSQVTNMSYMFNDCRQLISLDASNLDTSKVTNMIKLFYDCEKLKTVNLFGWDMSKCNDQRMMFGTTYSSMYKGYYSLKTVLGPITGIGASWDDSTTAFSMEYCSLDNASAMVFINGLAEVTTAKNITFSQTTYDTLTDEQISVATSKGWNVVRSAY